MKLEKSKTIIIVFLLFFSLATIAIYKLSNKEEEVVETDALKFKEEYEAYNNQVNEDNNKIYPSMSVSENNPMYYASYEEIYKVLKGTGVIYLGYPKCPWCRNLVPTLIEAAKKVNIGKIYYMNLYEERNTLSLDKDGNIVVEKEGTEGYTTLVEKLYDVLPVYEGLNNDTRRRIYVPLVIFVKDGEIIGTHSGTVDSQEDPYIELTEKQKSELKNKLANYLLQISDSACDSTC